MRTVYKITRLAGNMLVGTLPSWAFHQTPPDERARHQVLQYSEGWTVAPVRAGLINPIFTYGTEHSATAYYNYMTNVLAETDALCMWRCEGEEIDDGDFYRLWINAIGIILYANGVRFCSKIRLIEPVVYLKEYEEQILEALRLSRIQSAEEQA